MPCYWMFLTPVAKTYPSEMGIVSVSQALQCLGGYGYCDEFPLEQFTETLGSIPSTRELPVSKVWICWEEK